MAEQSDPRDVRAVRPGDPIRGAWLSGAAKGLDDERRKMPPLPRIPGIKGFWAEVTNDNGGKYTFVEVHLPEENVAGDGLTWVEPTATTYQRTGDCYECNGNEDVEDDSLEFLYIVQGTDGEDWYVFSHPAGGGGDSFGFVRVYQTTPPLGDWIAADGTTYDDKSGSHYSITDRGNGYLKATHVLPGTKQGDVLIVASEFHMLEDE